MKVKLIIIFNHRFDRNITMLNNLYSSRFSSICYLIPFYDGSKYVGGNQVIPVYDSSYQFNGFFAQGFNDFYEDDIDYYFFVGDDVLLKREVNEDSLFDILEVEPGECFIDSLKPLREFDNWGFEHESRIWASWKAFHNNVEVNWKSELPDYDRSIEKAKGYGFSPADEFISPASLIIAHNKNYKNSVKHLCGQYYRRILFDLYHFKYSAKVLTGKEKFGFPLFCGWSDVLFINKKSIKEFCRLCGIFASLRLFAEIAVPTAVVQACDSIVTNKNNPFFLGMLTPEILVKIEKEYAFNLEKLLTQWPDYIKTCYIHPIKLSKWK